MARKAPEDVRNITCLGAGPIGGGWAAYFLSRGYDVTSWVHDASEELKLRGLVDAAWEALTELGLADGASRDRWTITTDMAAAVAEADFVQESVPESLELKQSVYAELGALVPDGVVICSSTSGLSITDIQAKCPTPERTVTGHPFNPPYLMPLVEIVGGEKSDADAVAWTGAFFKQAGKAPLVMDREVPGFVATRLQEAIWREALHMVNEGEATVEQIDIAVTNGPGPRWALMGPCMVYHVGGGEGGMRYCLEQFGPALKFPWTRLIAPELTDELTEKMVEGSEEAAGGADFLTMTRKMNDGLVKVLKARREAGFD
ncbi:MAG: 3-hydroxybutyryl-CoA dehydrogenase [Rhodospirillaceae bacterium]|nr:3-hydroxybutyryl-CoA dehydrogenase [Rhodospirillaceae bacterium]|tara:strand:+ start:360 stop:1310 length:951 start_codon:yes stop_codon:yes gene_type:complete